MGLGRFRRYHVGRAEPVRSSTNRWRSLAMPAFPLPRGIMRAVGYASIVVLKWDPNFGCVTSVVVSRPRVSWYHLFCPQRMAWGCPLGIRVCFALIYCAPFFYSIRFQIYGSVYVGRLCGLIPGFTRSNLTCFSNAVTWGLGFSLEFSDINCTGFPALFQPRSVWN